MRRRGPSREQKREKEFRLKYNQSLKKLNGIPLRLGEMNPPAAYMSARKFAQLVITIDARLATASADESAILLKDKEYLESQMKWMREFSGFLEEELGRQ